MEVQQEQQSLTAWSSGLLLKRSPSRPRPEVSRYCRILCHSKKKVPVGISAGGLDMRAECEGSSLDSCRSGPALQAVTLAVSTLTTYIVSGYRCPSAPPLRFTLSVRSTAIAFPTGIAMYLLYATDNQALTKIVPKVRENGNFCKRLVTEYCTWNNIG